MVSDRTIAHTTSWAYLLVELCTDSLACCRHGRACVWQRMKGRLCNGISGPHKSPVLAGLCWPEESGDAAPNSPLPDLDGRNSSGHFNPGSGAQNDHLRPFCTQIKLRYRTDRDPTILNATSTELD